MFIEEINLIGFRNYLELSLVTGNYNKVIIVGKNAQGKSNLLEVIQVLSGSRASRASKDSELINFNLDSAIIRAKIRASTGESSQIAILVRPSGRRQIKINDVNKSKVELRNHINSVSFAASDLELITGSPSVRRDYLDLLISQLDSNYEAELEAFEKILKQRNGFISNLVEQGVYHNRLNPSQRDELRLWDDLYINNSNQLITSRLAWLSKLEPLCQTYYEDIADKPEEELQIKYLGSLLSPEELRANLPRDFARMHSTLGPQRHDIEFLLQHRSAANFASQGQKRSIVLALKLAELELLSQLYASKPILVLDDVLAELDCSRQAALMRSISEDTQVFISSSELSRDLQDWIPGAKIIEISNGRIQETIKI